MMKGNKPPVTGIVLAGGQSQRMGYNKALARLHGRRLIDRVIEILEQVTPGILISTANEAPGHTIWPAVSDKYPQSGPMGGIQSALQESSTVLNLVVSCDMPFLSLPFLKYFVHNASEQSYDVFLPVDENYRWQPLCAVYHRRILSLLTYRVRHKQLKLTRFISELHYRLLPIDRNHPLYSPGMFLNVNTPEMLNIAAKMKDTGFDSE